MKWKRKIASYVIAVAVLVAAYLFGCSYPVHRPVPFNEVTMSRAVEWVCVNRNTSLDGAIPLPPSLALVSATGKAYVTGGVIFFPSLIGRRTLLTDPFSSDADQVEGYGYSREFLPTLESVPTNSNNFFCMIDLSDPATQSPCLSKATMAGKWPLRAASENTGTKSTRLINLFSNQQRLLP